MAIIGEKKKGFFGRLSERIGDVIMARPSIDEDMLDELEEILITSDIGMDTTVNIMERLREKIKTERISEPEAVKGALAEVIAGIMDKGERQALTDETPLVILVTGINGGGKTTSIAKLGYRLKSRGKTVMFAAADTFRAAAAEQLSLWGERTGIPVVRHAEGADPSAVIFDAIQSAKARGIDVLICDTAGRLQTSKNLMKELEKMNRVISREYGEAARETLLVLDATTGKNAISQAKEFNEAAEITGIILTKLDGTARGGIAVTVTDEFDIPIKFIGVGEKMEDLKVFDPEEFAGGIFDE
ncbi:MAG TPA: signal recognition particle-docking protein FtsY [Candidatus Avanaerovorax faecigallinarum]|nr:signal recognition particle-docking protein FtsY [Candidatus Avanaerovorax faecigallinarum]